jgi:hypothetical protein
MATTHGTLTFVCRGPKPSSDSYLPRYVYFADRYGARSETLGASAVTSVPAAWNGSNCHSSGTGCGAIPPAAAANTRNFWPTCPQEPALALPATARITWVGGHRVVAGIAWALWTVTIVMTLMATIGFAALNVTDTVAARSRVAAEGAALTARTERLRFERAHIAEMRSVGTIEAELQRAQPSAAGVWRATSGCRDVTLPESGHACAEVLALREALGTAQRRDVLDADLDRTEAQLARLPAVTAPDPQSETAARLVNWATFGMINTTANDVNLARVTSMILMPQTAGLVLLLAMTLWPCGGKNASLQTAAASQTMRCGRHQTPPRLQAFRA